MFILHLLLSQPALKYLNMVITILKPTQQIQLLNTLVSNIWNH